MSSRHKKDGVWYLVDRHRCNDLQVSHPTHRRGWLHSRCWWYVTSHIRGGIITPLIYLSTSVAAPTSSEAVLCPDGVNFVTREACCKLFAILDDIQENLFDGGKCNAEAHEALRLTFSDAIAISKEAETGGGADGSIMLFSEVETAYAANVGLDEVVAIQKPFFERHDISAADFIQFAGAVAVSNCPGAPRLPFFLGRVSGTEAAPDGLVPEAFHSANQILSRFADAGPVGFSPTEVVRALAAHSVGAADDVDIHAPQAALDTTPFTFDTQFFLETLLEGTTFPTDDSIGAEGEVHSAVKGVLRLESDQALARDPRMTCEWQSLVNNQSKMQAQFSDVWLKLSLLGQDVHLLTDCSDVIPIPQRITAHATFPPTLSKSDLQQTCISSPFPTLETAPGPAITIPPVPKNLALRPAPPEQPPA
ncbi:manganese peroxidase 1 precursor [Cristinia sonorae]|uniref:Peroxidase n=1 Tax=Cristinia sonorae TaxID=1940300 RepID=A0A8K0XR31_9AGAR|nr:manganese peroxidase 1 precursor [Cristinia sonorae]